MFTISITLRATGGMSVPVGLGRRSGMPIGVQLVAPMFKDENMLRVGAALRDGVRARVRSPRVRRRKGG